MPGKWRFSSTLATGNPETTEQKALSFLDSRAGGKYRPPEPLVLAFYDDDTKIMLQCCESDGGNLSVLEFFTVGKTFRALFWCAVRVAYTAKN